MPAGEDQPYHHQLLVSDGGAQLPHHHPGRVHLVAVTMMMIMMGMMVMVMIMMMMVMLVLMVTMMMGEGGESLEHRWALHVQTFLVIIRTKNAV